MPPASTNLLQVTSVRPASKALCNYCRGCGVLPILPLPHLETSYWFDSNMAANPQIPEGLLPPPRPGQVYVTISALQGGHLTLPEYLFVTDSGPGRRTTVPSLAFLVRHEAKFGNKTTNIVFDLGMKRNASEFPPAMQSHISNRQPTSAHPDVAEFLRMGGISPTEIDTVSLSHVRRPCYSSKTGPEANVQATGALGPRWYHGRCTTIHPSDSQNAGYCWAAQGAERGSNCCP